MCSSASWVSPFCFKAELTWREKIYLAIFIKFIIRGGFVEIRFF